AICGPGRDEMAAVLLRTVLSNRDFSRPIERGCPRASAGDPICLAVARVGLGKLHVETRPRALPSRRRIVHACRVRCPEISLKSRDTTQPWHDFTSIKANPFLQPMGSKSRAATRRELLEMPSRRQQS